MEITHSPRADDKATQLAHEIAKAIETEANVKAVFGAPIKLETHTVIPIATIRIAVGGGMGSVSMVGKMKEAVEHVLPRSFGGGGGAELNVRPVGFVHESQGGVVFTPIPHDASFDHRH